MPDASREDIEGFFGDAGWSYHRLEGEDWETRYSGTYTNQVITVRMTQYWVYFYATLINRIDEACRSKMFEHMAMLNYKVSFGKFSIDKSNRLCLGVEVPRENLQASVFKDALNALSYLIDEHFRELLNIATDPDYVSRLKVEQEGGGAAAVAPTLAASSDSADEDVDWSDEDEAEDEDTMGSAANSAAEASVPTAPEVAASGEMNTQPLGEASSDNQSQHPTSTDESPASDVASSLRMASYNCHWVMPQIVGAGGCPPWCKASMLIFTPLPNRFGISRASEASVGSGCPRPSAWVKRMGAINLRPCDNTPSAGLIGMRLKQKHLLSTFQLPPTNWRSWKGVSDARYLEGAEYD